MKPLANQNHDRRERGAIAALAGILMLTLVGMTVVGVDLGRLAFTASEVQNVADVGATAYAKAMLLNKGGGSRTPEADALTVVSDNAIDGAQADSGNMESYDVGNFTRGVGFTRGGAPQNAVMATATVTVDNFFATLFGTPQSTVRKTATAGFDCPAGGEYVLPIAVGDCEFDTFQNSEDCADLPTLFQQPRDNSCWTSLSGDAAASAAAARAILPEGCCHNNTCGGGEDGPAVTVGDDIRVQNGATGLLQILAGCLTANPPITDFVIPIVECNDADTNCTQARELMGFASVRILNVVDTGPVASRGVTLEFFCNHVPPNGPPGGGCFGTEAVYMFE
jgi:Flp pilus assembly protein TadG